MTETNRRAQTLLSGLDTLLWDQLKVIADHYEDIGDEGLARAYRWLATARLAPLRFADWYHWRCNESGTFSYLPLGHHLPSEILNEMKKMPARLGKNATDFDSISEAYQAAAECFVSYELSPHWLPF